MASLLNSLKSKMTKSPAASTQNAAKSDERTRIIMLVDETGSMSSHKAVTISSFNEWLDSNRTKEEDEDQFPKFTLVKFNTTCRIQEHDSVENAPRLTEDNYKPSNMTALYDAIGETLTQYKTEKDNIMVILTDGQENSSRKFTESTIKPMIKEFEDDKGWLFHFLGADQNAWQAASRMGMSDKKFANSYDADEDGFGHAFASNAEQVKVYRGYQAKKKKGYAVSKSAMVVPQMSKSQYIARKNQMDKPMQEAVLQQIRSVQVKEDEAVAQALDAQLNQNSCQ